jgi:hypothetical protein
VHSLSCSLNPSQTQRGNSPCVCVRWVSFLLLVVLE